MRCIIEGNGVKAFGKAIHGLSRIGDELWLDPMAKGLAVRSVNSAHSAYGCFLFTPLFFQHYSLSPEGGTAKCKLAMKSVLPLFRCLATIERNVARCEVSIDIPENRVIFLFYCRHGITKTHMLGYQESEALQAVYPAHLCLNVLKAQSRLIADMVMHFPASQEEITLSISPLRLLLKTHQEKCDGLKAMFTEMSLHSSEFDYFQVGVDSDITFCLKELRGLLSFAESHGLPVSVYFGEAGRPVCFSVDDMVLEARVVLATLVDPESTTPSQAEVLPPAAVRCEGVAAFPDGPQGPGLGSPRDLLAAGELIPSSQGSPVLGCAALVRQLMRPGNLERLPTASQSDRQPATISRTPASAKIRSFLFGALSTEQGNVHTGLPPSLVCASDSEDDAEEGHS